MSSICIRKMDTALFFNSYEDSREKNKELSVNISLFQLFITE